MLKSLKYKILSFCKSLLGEILFRLFGLFKNDKKIVATTMRGRKYGDNPKFIIEKIRELRPDIDIVWLSNKQYSYDLPAGIKRCDYYSPIRKIYEYATAKVWLNSHRIESYIKKRKGQLFIETWHGGLGIKKIESDQVRILSDYSINEIRNTSKLADVFISNSDHLSNIYRNAFKYEGPILKCGYPKNDIFFNGDIMIRKKVRDFYNIAESERIIMYAPTFRDSFERLGVVDFSLFAIDFKRLKDTLKMRFGCKWKVLIKWHPVMATYLRENKTFDNKDAIDATEYPDMQELILSVDAIISDYSSCIFDAAIREIPCFTYAVDFDDYKKERGVYYNMEELPFPYAKNNEELMNNIKNYTHEDYIQKWHAFSKKTGLTETGHASETIAKKILDFIDGKEVIWE